LAATSPIRIDVAGVPVIDGLTLSSSERFVLVLGGPRALFEAAASMRPVERGSLLVDGSPPELALSDRLAAAAPLDPRMPPRWTVRQYMSWSARLSGLPRLERDEALREVIDRLQLASYTSSRLATASTAVRRATVIGAALATRAPTLLVEDPTTDLPGDVGKSFARVVASALAGRKVVLFAGRIALDSPLTVAAGEAVVLDGSVVAAQGPPAEIAARANSFAVRAVGNVDALTSALAEQGGVLHPSGGDADRSRFTVDLGSLGTSELFGLAERCDAVVLELRPLTRVFA
jgi:ABC-type multidrug transport system ATPase subunit